MGRQLSLVECAEELRLLDSNSPQEYIDELIVAGKAFLQNGCGVCNPIQRSALDNRIKRAQFILQEREEVLNRKRGNS